MNYKIGDYVWLKYIRETILIKSEEEIVLVNEFKKDVRKATSEEIERYERSGK